MSKFAPSIFFLGKGGVGKSTLSALSALQLAKKGATVILISMDPAHNLADIFQLKLTEKMYKVENNLYVIEINLKMWLKKYLSSVEQQMKKNYRYLTAFNLEKNLEIIRFAPGIEEYGLFLAYHEIIKKYEGHDYYIFDMPPTALAIKFLNLPSLSLLWLEKLLDLRKEIIKKRNLVTKIKFGMKEKEIDKVLTYLEKQINNYQDIQKSLADSEITKFNLVMNPDKLSWEETKDIYEIISGLNFKVHQVFINKYEESVDFAKYTEVLGKLRIRPAKIADFPLIGISNLERYLNDNPESLVDFQT
jgi:arsenite-transporting ATPase